MTRLTSSPTLMFSIWSCAKFGPWQLSFDQEEQEKRRVTSPTIFSTWYCTKETHLSCGTKATYKEEWLKNVPQDSTMSYETHTGCPDVSWISWNWSFASWIGWNRWDGSCVGWGGGYDRWDDSWSVGRQLNVSWTSVELILGAPWGTPNWYSRFWMLQEVHLTDIKVHQAVTPTYKFQV